MGDEGFNPCLFLKSLFPPLNFLNKIFKWADHNEHTKDECNLFFSNQIISTLPPNFDSSLKFSPSECLVKGLHLPLLLNYFFLLKDNYLCQCTRNRTITPSPPKHNLSLPLNLDFESLIKFHKIPWNLISLSKQFQRWLQETATPQPPFQTSFTSFFKPWPWNSDQIPNNFIADYQKF